MNGALTQEVFLRHGFAFPVKTIGFLQLLGPASDVRCRNVRACPVHQFKRSTKAR